jgi:hypothetical protein
VDAQVADYETRSAVTSDGISLGAVKEYFFTDAAAAGANE